MKKFFVFFAAVAVSAIVFSGIISCKKSKAVSLAGESIDIAPKLVSLDSASDRVFDAGNFFTPDYTPYEPEPESTSGKVNLSSPKTVGAKIESIIPGLRKLSEYKTKYNSKKSDFKIPEVTKMAGADTFSSKGKKSKAEQPFTVANWGPQGVIPGDVRFPSFYVLFSEPVVALSSLNQQSDASEFLKIEPEVKGVFRWNGTSLLSFDTTEAVNPLQVYTITVSENVKSLSGKSITGERVFKTESAPLEIIWSAPGYSKNKWIDKNEVPPECAKEFRVQFNYAVNAEEIAKISTINLNRRKDRLMQKKLQKSQPST